MPPPQIPGPFVVPAPYIRGYPQATVLQPTDAFVIDRENVGTMFIEGDNIGGGGGLTDGTYINGTIIISNGVIVTVSPGLHSIQFIVNGGGSPIAAPAVYGDLRLPFDCTLTECWLLADQAATIEADIWNAPMSGYPPTIDNTIIPDGFAITTDTDHQLQDLTGATGGQGAWITALVDGSLRFQLNSNDNAVTLTIALLVTTP